MTKQARLPRADDRPQIATTPPSAVNRLSAAFWVARVFGPLRRRETDASVAAAAVVQLEREAAALTAAGRRWGVTLNAPHAKNGGDA